MEQNKKSGTPALANWLASKFLKKAQHDEFLGDLEEMYWDRLSRSGKPYACTKYWLDMLHILIGFSILNPFKTNAAMYKHYLIIAKRNLWRNKVHSSINILSLGIGMGVCLLIAAYVHFEFSYDRFHDNLKNTYRVVIGETKEGGEKGSAPYTSYAFAETAEAEIPEIDGFVRVYQADESAVVTNPEIGKPIGEDAADFLFVDKSFLDRFNFPLKAGTPESVLDGLYDIVITEEIAQKYFGPENPLGKGIRIDGGNSPGDYTVTGVLEKLPLNSHLRFDFLLPLENFWKVGNGGSVNRYGGWERKWYGTYFTVGGTSDPAMVGEKLDALLLKYKGEVISENRGVEKTVLQPLGDIHLKSGTYAIPDYAANKGNLLNVRIFALIAFFILFTAWFNYINLSTARSMHRAKEVGIRKSIGAQKKQLVRQFLTESFLVNLTAAMLALGFALSALPLLGSVIGKELDYGLFNSMLFWVSFLAVVVLGSILSGLYPAFVLSSFRPISALGGGKSASLGNLNLRKGLIAFQFVTSLLLIAGTFLVYKQVTFMKSQELGMDIEKILVLKGPTIVPDAPEVTDGTDMEQIRASQAFGRTTFDAFRRELEAHSSISSVTGSRAVPGMSRNISRQDIRKMGEPESAGKYGKSFPIGTGFVETYGLELLAGGSFSEDMAKDEYVIVNQEALRAYGLGSPRDALQEKIMIGSRPRTIAGVVKDFHWQSLKDAHTPYVLRSGGGINVFISAKIGTSDIAVSLAYIESIYNTFYPDNPFDYFFMDDAFDRQYREDIQFGNLFLGFSLLAIFIGCIGLFALVSYSANLKMKEIGIRKVLGASTGNLMLLLSKEYLVMLGMAVILSIPAILYFGKLWLANYAFRTEMGVDIVLAPALVLFVIAILTVSRQTYSTATSNPVDALRPE
ncbi:ABC transporter permease [Ulvibacterium sp.]|uniref:ABC transporter permease n=1 Tax=Ulvibacterium sp. TaxID=2665914 RepID=UPI003BACD5E5